MKAQKRKFLKENVRNFRQMQGIAQPEEQKGGGYVITCFIDIRKAFPGVVRSVLYNKLAKNKNIPTSLLLAVANIVQSFCLSIQTDFGMSEIVNTEYGIPEGNVLSPLLWAISKHGFEDGVADLDEGDQHPAPTMHGMDTSTIMYVDDEKISSLEKEGMNRKLSRREQYYKENGCVPNIGKTEIMVAHDPRV